MSVIQQIREMIEAMPAGELFSTKAFRTIASADNIKQVLSRLAKEGVILRARRGIYSKPKIVKNIGAIPPSTHDIAKTIAESTGETILIQGAEAARQFQLSTQVPMRLIFYTNGNSRTLKIGKQTIELKHVNPSRLIAARSIAGTAISALLYFGKEHVNNEIIEKIRMQLSPQDFKKVLHEIENMPVWLASAFHDYKKEKKHDK